MRTVCLSSSFARVANWLTVRSSQTIVCISNQDIAFTFSSRAEFYSKGIVASKLPRRKGIQISSEVLSLAWCKFIMAAKKKFAEEFTVQSFRSNHRDKENFHFFMNEKHQKVARFSVFLVRGGSFWMKVLRPTSFAIFWRASEVKEIALTSNLSDPDFAF